LWDDEGPGAKASCPFSYKYDMSTFRKIITSAHRKLGLVGEGQKLTQYAFSDALETSQGLLRGWITSGAFGRLRDVMPAGDYTAGENERVYRTGNDPKQKIELPSTVTDKVACFSDYGRHSFISEHQRAVRNGAVITIADKNTGRVIDFIYDGQQKVWFPIYELSVDYDPDTDIHADAKLNRILAMECPIAYGDPNGFACCIAIQIAADYGSPIPDPVKDAARNFTIALTHSYSTRDYGRDR
jgi:hypothetical protein